VTKKTEEKRTIIEIKPSPAKEVVKKTVVKKPTVVVEEEIPFRILNPTVRYSDVDLEMFKERISDVRHEAIEELRMLRERLEDLTNYDFAEESMIYSMHMAEQGSEAFEKEKTYAQIQRINEYIKKLDDALARIKDKTFGICRVCGCLIAKERLFAVPITTLSASYKIQKRCPEDGIDRIEPLRKEI
jgi:RNA polymerase-binding transcription factor DksA